MGKTIMEKEDVSASLIYARALFANILDWYKNADLKAEILLTITGAFLSFFTGAVFVKEADLKHILCFFGPETWILMGLTVIGLVMSIVSALICLRSRLADPKDYIDHISEVNRDKEGNLKQWPETLYFFGMIAQLVDRKKFQVRLSEFSNADEIKALSSQIFLVSKNVSRKHKWVNIGFLFIALTLLFFLASAVSYVVRVNMF